MKLRVRIVEFAAQNEAGFTSAARASRALHHNWPPPRVYQLPNVVN